MSDPTDRPPVPSAPSERSGVTGPEPPGPERRELESLGRGRWIELVRIGPWEYARRIRGRRACVIVAVTPRGELLLVEQPRASLGRPTIELPAGLVGDDVGHEQEAVAQAAARELIEEVGYEPGQIREVAEGCASAGITDERLTILVASELRRVGPGGGVNGEEITVHAIPLAEVPAWLAAQQAAGKVIDLKIWAGLWHAHQRGPG